MMMQKARFFGIIALAAVIGLSMTGCPNAGTPETTEINVTVSPVTATVVRGGTQYFTALIFPRGNTPNTVTWAVTGGGSGTSISSGTTTSYARLTVAANETATTLTVRATSTHDTSRSSTATVTVTSPDATVTDVTVSPATATVVRGGTQDFTVTVDGIDDPPTTVTWAVTGGGTGTSISPAGRLTIAANETATTLTVRATSTHDTGISGTATVTVTSPDARVTGVTVNPATATVLRGGTQDFTVTVEGTGNPPTTVTWAVTGGGIGTSISPAGRLTIAANETAATLTVRATSTHDTGRSGTATVTVTSPDARVTGVTVNPATATVVRGGTQDFTVTVEGTGNPPTTVTWAVTGGGAGTSISPAGRLTIAANETAATLTVSATSTHDTSRSGTATVTVTSQDATVTDVTVSPATATVVRGGTQDFTVTVEGTNNPPTTVTWAVTGGGTSTSISPAGRLTVAANEAATTLTVLATSTHDTGISGTATVTVTTPEATVTGVTVSPETASVARGGTQDFAATVDGTNSPPQTVTWTVEGGLAGTTISETGRLTLALNETAATLTVRATSTHDTSRSGTATVTNAGGFNVPTGFIGRWYTTAGAFIYEFMADGRIFTVAGYAGRSMSVYENVITVYANGAAVGTANFVLSGNWLTLSNTGTSGLVPGTYSRRDITYTAIANYAFTTAINLEFNHPVSGLTTGHITVVDEFGAVMEGVLSGDGRSWSLAVTVARAGNVQIWITKPGIESGVKTVRVGNTREDFTISLAEFTDRAPEVAIPGPPIRIVGSPEETTRRVTVTDHYRFDNGSIGWYFRGTRIAGDMIDGDYGETLILGPRIHGNLIGLGTHFLTVEGRINGVPYGIRIAFTVER